MEFNFDKYDDVIFLHPSERGGSAQERNCPSPVVCALSMSVSYSTHTDVTNVVKRCYDVQTTVCRLCSVTFLQRSTSMWQQKQVRLWISRCHNTVVTVSTHMMSTSQVPSVNVITWWKLKRRSERCCHAAMLPRCSAALASCVPSLLVFCGTDLQCNPLTHHITLGYMFPHYHLHNHCSELSPAPQHQMCTNPQLDTVPSKYNIYSYLRNVKSYSSLLLFILWLWDYCLYLWPVFTALHLQKEQVSLRLSATDEAVKS